MTYAATLEGLYREKYLILFDPSTGKELTEEELGLMTKLSLNTCESAIDLLTNSERQYTRLFDTLKYNWVINCERDDKLTDRIERCEAALTTLHNLGFNLCTGEVNQYTFVGKIDKGRAPESTLISNQAQESESEEIK